MSSHPIAIIGGGPAGALAGSVLGAGGKSVLLFDEKLAWEKPCGGGLTHKALQQYPFLADAGSASNRVEHCELISPSGRRARFFMRHPVAIFSRLTLNGLLLERARSSGVNASGNAQVDVRRERVTRIAGSSGDWRLFTPTHEYRSSYLVLAAGARNPFRTQFLSPIEPSDLMVTAGYFIPGRSCPDQGSAMQIQFLEGIHGYIWVFPRVDHVSAGIAGKMGETSAAELRRRLERWLDENGFDIEGARFYSHILPSLRPETFETLEVCGEGWATIGDSAGLVDPITGEGLYYALRSGELWAKAMLAGRPDKYRTMVKEEIISELKLAARVSRRFYSGQVFGGSVLERMVSLTEQSTSFRELMSDLFAGIQGYRDLKARMYRMLPAVMSESVLSAAVRWPRSGNGVPEFAADLPQNR